MERGEGVPNPIANPDPKPVGCSFRIIPGLQRSRCVVMMTYQMDMLLLFLFAFYVLPYEVCLFFLICFVLPHSQITGPCLVTTD